MRSASVMVFTAFGSRPRRLASSSAISVSGRASYSGSIMRSAQYTVSAFTLQAMLPFSHHVATGSTMSQYWREASKKGAAPHTKSTLRKTLMPAFALGSEFRLFS